MQLTKRDGFYLVISAGVVLLYVLTANGGFPLDDSWIHQVYARNLAERGEWAFIPGEPSAASTSPLYTVLLAVGYVLNMPYAFWAHLLGALALAITAMLAGRLAERLLSYETFSAFVTGVGIVLLWHLIWAASAGMETMLFGMFTLVLVWLSWREIDRLSTDSRYLLWRGAIFGVAAALATLTRPEGVVLAGIIGLMMLVFRPHGSWRSVLLWSIGAGIGFMIFITPYLLLNLSLTGGLLPATSDAKYAQHAPLLEYDFGVRLLNMIIPIIAGGQFLLLPGIVYYGFWVQRQAKGDPHRWLYLVPLLWAIALIVLYTVRLPASYQHGRYVIPALPALGVIGVIGTIVLVRRVYNRTIPRVLMMTVAISAVFAFIYFGVILGPSVYDNDVAVIDEEMVANAQWIEANIPPDELLAVHDIGAVGYFASRPILDMAGLVSPEVADIYHDEMALWSLLRERDAQYLMGFLDQLPGRTDADERLCPLHRSDGRTAVMLGGSKMTIYTLSWSGECD